MRQHPVEKWMCNAKTLQIAEETSQVQKAIIPEMLAVEMEQ